MDKRRALDMYGSTLGFPPGTPPSPPAGDIPWLAELANAHDIAIRIRALQDDLETTLGRLERALAGGLPDRMRRKARARGRGVIP